MLEILAQAILIVGENFHDSFQGSETVAQRCFIIKAVGFSSAQMLAFLWFLQKFSEQLFYSTLVNGCFWTMQMFIFTAQKMKFSSKDFFSKCDQIRSFLRIWSHLLKKLFCGKLQILCSVCRCAQRHIWKTAEQLWLRFFFSKLINN